jgi:HK97 family phage portal protein
MNIFEKKTTQPQFWNVNTSYNYKRATADEIVRDGYLGNEDVYSCVSRFARLCANTPLQLMNGDDLVPVQDEVYKLFFDSWNTKQGKNEAMYQLFVELFLHGKATILKQAEVVGFQPSELWVLPTQAVTPSQVRVGYFDKPPFYTFVDNTKSYKYFSEELIIIEYFDPSTLQEQQQGMSPLQGVWNTVSSSNNRSEAEKSMLQNRGVSGFISPKTNAGGDGLGFTNQALKVVREAFAALTGGSDKFNKVEVLEQSAEFTQLGLNANDLKIVEMRLNHVRAICNSYGLPSLLFNDYQSRTHANYKEAMKALYTDAKIPQVELFIIQFQKHLFEQINLLAGEKYWLKIDLGKIEPLKADQEKLRAGVLAQYEKNLITKKEARTLLGFSAEMEEEDLEGTELLRSLSPLLANNIIGLLSEEDRNRLIEEMGLIK